MYLVVDDYTGETTKITQEEFEAVRADAEDLDAEVTENDTAISLRFEDEIYIYVK
jgi:hypothetical protein